MSSYRQTRRSFVRRTGATTAAIGALATAGCLGGDDEEGLDEVDSVEIELWHGLSGDLAEEVSSLAEDFSDQSDTITVEAVEQGSYRETMNQTINAVRSGEPPGISQIFEVGTKTALDSGAFVPIEEAIPEDRIDWDSFLAPVLDYYRIDGALNSMPFNSSNAIMMYNRDAFSEAGIDPDSPPRSFQDVLDYSDQLMDAGYEYGITWPNHSWFVEQWFAGQDSLLVNNDNGRDGDPTETFINEEAGTTIFEFIQELMDKDAVLSTGIEAWGEAQQGFFTQEAPIVLYSTSSINPMLQGAADNDFEASAARLPVPGGEQAGVTIGGGSLWVPDEQGQAEEEAAIEFLLWLTEPEQQSRWHQNTGYFPVREESIENLTEEGFYDENPAFRVALDQLEADQDTSATRGAVVGPFLDLRTTVAESYVAIADGDSVDEVLADAKDEIDEALEDYNERQSE